jgi:ribonucleoside-diphosphate reductase alpha chain
MINPEELSPKDLYDLYLQAWQSGIKTTYYVRSMSAEVSESCESCAG